MYTCINLSFNALLHIDRFISVNSLVITTINAIYDVMKNIYEMNYSIVGASALYTCNTCNGDSNL